MTLAVALLAHTPEPDSVVAAAARLCYSPVSATGLMDDSDRERDRKFLAHLERSGHFSPFEHVSFTFALDGLSRICTHQLVRHRVASYSQQSQRYVTMEDPAWVTPPSIQGRPETEKLFAEAVREAHAMYARLVESGIPKEDARYILPHGFCTRIVVTMNARELHHFFRLRLCRRAQWEIRETARRMLVLAREAAPGLFCNAGPDCAVKGECSEARPCGRPYADIEEVLGDSTIF